MALGNLASRVLVAVLLVPVIFYCVYQDNPLFTWLLVFPASAIAMWEIFAMMLDERVDRFASLGFGIAAVLALYWVPIEYGGHLLPYVLAVVPVGLYYLFRFRDMETVAVRYASTSAGILYAGVTVTFLAMVKRDLGVYGGDMVIFVLGCMWFSDTGAYTFGRLFGKSKLYPAVSPGKTWAGALGGVLFGVGFGFGLKLLRLDGLAESSGTPLVTSVDIVVLAVPGVILGMLGDLIESMFKRSRKVKDSGTLLGGHGGMLDRIDAVLLYAPYVYLYFMIRPLLVG